MTSIKMPISWEASVLIIELLPYTHPNFLHNFGNFTELSKYSLFHEKCHFLGTHYRDFYYTNDAGP